MSQEIYDDLGDVGAVFMLGLLVAGIDGDVDEKELDSLANTYNKMTSDEEFSTDHLKEVIEKVNAASQALGTFENKLNFAVAVLNTFKKKYDEDVRKALMHEYTAIASADFEVHENETALLGLYAKHLL
jgi:uncharacterized tellurite resistance protein B-like protein